MRLEGFHSYRNSKFDSIILYSLDALIGGDSMPRWSSLIGCIDGGHGRIGRYVHWNLVMILSHVVALKNMRSSLLDVVLGSRYMRGNFIFTFSDLSEPIRADLSRQIFDSIVLSPTCNSLHTIDIGNSLDLSQILPMMPLWTINRDRGVKSQLRRFSFLLISEQWGGRRNTFNPIQMHAEAPPRPSRAWRVL